jgi:hypothetical protein
MPKIILKKAGRLGVLALAPYVTAHKARNYSVQFGGVSGADLYAPNQCVRSKCKCNQANLSRVGIIIALGDPLPDSGVPSPVYRYTCNDVGVKLLTLFRAGIPAKMVLVIWLSIPVA